MSYFCPVLTKSGYSRHIIVKVSNIKLYKRPRKCMRQMDSEKYGFNEAKKLFSQRTRTLQKSNMQNKYTQF